MSYFTSSEFKFYGIVEYKIPLLRLKDKEVAQTACLLGAISSQVETSSFHGGRNCSRDGLIIQRGLHG